MEKEFKTQILIGALGAAVLCAGGYGLYRESQRPDFRAPDGKVQALDAGAADEQDSGATRTVLRIETPQVVSANSVGHEAKVVGNPALQFEWSIQGGKLESENQRDSILWSAGPTGDVILTCRGFDASGAESMVAVRVPIRPVPTISVFEAVPAALTLGTTARLGWAVKDCRKLVLDPGGQDVTALSGPGFEVKPTENTTYRLTAMDDLGTQTTREVLLKVVPPPEIGSLRAEPRPDSPDAFTVIGEFKGGKAEMKEGGVVLASGDTSPLQASLSRVKPSTSVSLVVTNEAGASVTATVQFAAQKP